VRQVARARRLLRHVQIMARLRHAVQAAHISCFDLLLRFEASLVILDELDVISLQVVVI
jgi:hypothetical protein